MEGGKKIPSIEKKAPRELEQSAKRHSMTAQKAVAASEKEGKDFFATGRRNCPCKGGKKKGQECGGKASGSKVPPEGLL